MATADHADVPFVQALKYGKGRIDGPPLWIVWHTMQEHELGDTAERVARYFATLSDGRTVSAHYCVDNNSIIQCVRLADRAWTVGNSPGNNRGINVELAGFASQTPAQWADPYSEAMLSIACRIVSRDMAEYKIPNRWCTVDDLWSYRGGHTTHNDLRLAFGGTTHTDPGSGFPRQHILDLIKTGGVDVMTSEEHSWLAYTTWRLNYLAQLDEFGEVPGLGEETYPLSKAIKSIDTGVDTLLLRPPAEFTDEQLDVLATAIAEKLQPTLEAAADAGAETAIRRVLGSLDGLA